MTTSTRAAGRRYLFEFGGAMAAYVLVVLLSSWAVHDHPTADWRFAVAVTPIVPALFAMWAVLRHVRRLDERERLIQLQALTASTVVVGMVTFTYGFLEAAGAPSVSLVWVLPALIAVWGVGVAVANLRDR